MSDSLMIQNYEITVIDYIEMECIGVQSVISSMQTLLKR